MIIRNMEKTCSRFFGKAVLSLDSWSHDLLFLILIFLLVLVVLTSYILLRKRGESRVVSFFGFFLALVITAGNTSVAHATGDPGEAGPSGSAAPNPVCYDLYCLPVLSHAVDW